MSYEAEAARRYRAHAQELRTIAKSEAVVETRRTLIFIARDYERMALQIETTELANAMRSAAVPSPSA
jgi:hypothetical protein